MKTPYEAYHVECAAGWKALYQPLIDLCALYGVQVMQVKEKFGGLRFYVAGARGVELAPLISAAETASYHICEECGTYGASGWSREGPQTHLQGDHWAKYHLELDSLPVRGVPGEMGCLATTGEAVNHVTGARHNANCENRESYEEEAPDGYAAHGASEAREPSTGHFL